MSRRLAGLHPLTTLLQSDPQQIEQLWLDQQRSDKRLRQLAELAQRAGITPHWVDRPALDRLAGGVRHQGAVAEVAATSSYHESHLEQILLTQPAPLLLILDGVQDPHNLGASLRTADAAGVAAVVVPRDRACGLNATVSKVASGAAERVPLVQVTNLARTLRQLQQAGVHTVGAAGEAGSDDLYAADLRGPLALVLGAEGEGLRRLTRERCDQLVRIPMYGVVSSLNVSVAAGVLLYEAVRQRRVTTT